MLDKLSKLSGYDLKIKINDVKQLKLKEPSGIPVFIAGIKAFGEDKSSLNEAEKALKKYGGKTALNPGGDLIFIFPDSKYASAAETCFTAALSIKNAGLKVAIAAARDILSVQKPYNMQTSKSYGTIQELLLTAYPGDILVLEEDAPALRNIFQFKEKTHKSFKVLSVIKYYGKENLQRKLSPFAGREAELDTLKIIYNEVCGTAERKTAKPILTGIKGEAGIGKTRLISEFIQKYCRNENVLTGKTSRVLNEPYDIFISALKNVSGITESDTKAERKNKLELFYRYLTAKIKDRKEASRLKQSKAITGYLLGIDYEEPRLKVKDKELQEHVDISLRHFIEAYASALSGTGPVIFIIEDCHRIDSISKESLQYILSTFNLEKKRENKHLSKVMFIMLYRPEFEPGRKLTRDTEFTEITLDPLDENISLEIIKGLVKTDAEKYSEIVLQKSFGNPLFIEEWVSHFTEHPPPEKSPETVVKKNYNTAASSPMPENITSLIQVKTDRLEKEQKHLLQKASILGKSFPGKLLYEIEKKFNAGENMDAMLHDLINKDFIYSNGIPEQPAGEIIYSFKHDIIQEVVYNYTLPENRRIIHRIAAEVLEEQFKYELENHYFELAEHYSRTDCDEKAVFYLRKAGNKAKEEYKNELALDFYKRLFNLLKEETAKKDIYDILIKTGEVLLHIGRWDEGIENFTRALRIADLVKSRLMRATALTFIGEGLDYKNEYKRALKRHKEALKIFLAENYVQGIMRSLGLQGSIYSKEGKFKDAKKAFETQITLAEKHEEKDTVSFALHNLGLLYRRFGDYDKAIDYLKQNLELQKKIGDKTAIAKSLSSLGNVYYYKGELDKALTHFELAYRLSKDLGANRAAASALGNIGSVHFVRREHTRALEYYKKQKQIYEELNDESGLATSYGHLGNLHLSRGENQEALRYYIRHLNINKKIGREIVISIAISNIGVAYSNLGKLEKALSHFHEQLKIDKRLSNNEGIMRAYTNIAGIYVKTKKYKTAVINFKKAIRLGEQHKLQKYLLATLIEYAEMLVESKSLSTAGSIISRAAELFKYGTPEEIEKCKYLNNIINTSLRP
jgi:tetratricopeptide (TPR) repeat protein